MEKFSCHKRSERRRRLGTGTIFAAVHGEMSDYEVKNVEAVVVSNDIQVRVFTLAQGDVIPWHYHSGG